MNSQVAASSSDSTPLPQLELNSLFERILLATDGTVTELIALYAGEAIKVTKLEQTLCEQTAPAVLQCSAATALLTRKILLSGARRHYLYAESTLVFDRLSPFVQEQLLSSDQPIGLLWKAERLESYREVVERTLEQRPDVAAHFDLPAETRWVSRSYLVCHARKPIAHITEKWPLDGFGHDHTSA